MGEPELETKIKEIAEERFRQLPARNRQTGQSRRETKKKMLPRNVLIGLTERFDPHLHGCCVRVSRGREYSALCSARTRPTKRWMAEHAVCRLTRGDRPHARKNKERLTGIRAARCQSPLSRPPPTRDSRPQSMRAAGRSRARGRERDLRAIWEAWRWQERRDPQESRRPMGARARRVRVRTGERQKQKEGQ